MIRSLRRRFLLIAMFSLALTLFVIGGSINLGNYIRLTDRADAIITTLYENDWNFPLVRNHPNVSGRFQLTRETEFETRYCIIHLDENEEPSDVNSEHIASLSESDISALTDAILSSGNDSAKYATNPILSMHGIAPIFYRLNGKISKLVYHRTYGISTERRYSKWIKCLNRS